MEEGLLTSWLKAMIQASGLSQAELARKAGVGQAQISRFLSEDPKSARTINLDTADKLFRVVEPEYLNQFKEGKESAERMVKYTELVEKEYARMRGRRDELARIAGMLADAQAVILEVLGVQPPLDDLQEEQSD